MKICYKCYFCAYGFKSEWSVKSDYLCRYKQKVETDIITGEYIFVGKALECIKARKSRKLCGKEGKWFKKKEQVMIEYKSNFCFNGITFVDCFIKYKISQGLYGHNTRIEFTIEMSYSLQQLSQLYDLYEKSKIGWSSYSDNKFELSHARLINVDNNDKVIKIDIISVNIDNNMSYESKNDKTIIKCDL